MGGDDRRGSGGAKEFVAIDEDAASQADHEDVEAERDAAPEVDLKDRLAEPESLWLVNPESPEGWPVGLGHEVRTSLLQL